MRNRFILVLGLVGLVIVGLFVLGPSILRGNPVRAAVDIFASPVQGGCYIAGPSECRIHLEPYTLDLTTGTKLVQFQLVAIQIGTNIQTVIYDWRPDQSNPVPFIGSTYSPSPVAQDFAATCGKTYTVSLQGRNTGDPSNFNLGVTGQFTCPSSMP
jgi:hypothetical protein